MGNITQNVHLKIYKPTCTSVAITKINTNSYVSYFELKASINSGNNSSNTKALDWNGMDGQFGQTSH